MGQYYSVAINYLGDKEDVVYSNRNVENCDYIMAKLLEHSYFGNDLMDAVANILYTYETKLAWIGDYAEEDEVAKITNDEVSYLDCFGGNDEYGNEIKPKNDFVFPKKSFDYHGKYLVNLTKKRYISFDEYMAKATNDFQLNPISILTAIGNGRGGGDYFSKNKAIMEKVGSWAWDLITIDDEKPKGMKKMNVDFGSSI